MKKSLSSMICVLISAVMLLAGMGVMTVMAEEASETSAPAIIKSGDGSRIQDYFWEITEDMPEEEALKLAERNYRLIFAMQPLYTEKTYDSIWKSYVHFVRQGREEGRQEYVDALNAMETTSPVNERVWFIWDENNMPVVDGEVFTEEELDNGPRDSYGYVPFLITYLLDDPTQAKGNMVVCSGGGYSDRNNDSEGYPAAKVFNELGYNVFLLQRRLVPYSEQDIFMDMQRAIRLVRYHAAEEGWGGQDMIVAAGWSGGAGTVAGAINTAYGYLTPVDEGATAYIPDEIDTVNSDLDVAILVYGGSLDLESGNDNLPAIYTTVGSEDELAYESRIQLNEDAQALGLPIRLDVFEGAGHGFGVGQETADEYYMHEARKNAEGCKLWPGYADEFMDANRGFSGNVSAAEAAAPAAEVEGTENADLPEGYTKVKTFEGTYGFGDAELTVATNEEENLFYITFICFDEDQVLEGTVDDGIVTVDYDLSGFVSGDAQFMWDDAVASDAEWVSVQ